MIKSLISALAITVAGSALCGQEIQPDERQAQQIIERAGGFLAASKPRIIAQMSDQERQTLIRYYRGELAKVSGADVPPNKAKVEAPQYRDQLLRLGEPEILAERVKTVLESKVESPQFQAAYQDLLSAARPESVAMLAPGLLTDEPFMMKPQGDVGAIMPKSFGLAGGIMSVIAASPAFNEDVRAWADANAKVTPQKTLSMVRRWWRENETVLKGKQFSAVRPGEDLATADLAEMSAIQARQQAYRAELIAKGKNPADLANWEEWRNVIYPSLVAGAPASVATATLPPSSPVKNSEPAEAPIRTPAANSAHRLSTWALGIIGVAALVVIALLVWKRRI